MAVTLTVNYSLIKPNAFEEIDIWGPKLNDNWDDVDALLKALNDALALKESIANVALKANIASPAFTGNPTAPTPSPGDNDTSIATTAFVAAAVVAGGGAPINSPAFTGNPTAPTPSPGDNDTSIATTAFVKAADDLKANIASPTLTGVPAAPTAAPATNTTQLATTAFVEAARVILAAADAANLLTALAADKVVPENAQTGTTYTLVLTDAGKMVSMSNAGAIALTIPTNASVAFPVNTRIDLLQLGAGQVTVGGAGVTIQSSGSKLKLTGQYSGATLWKKATDTWVLIGDIAT